MKKIIYFYSALVIVAVFLSFETAWGQKALKGIFKDALVLDFSDPYSHITIDYEEDEIIVPVSASNKALSKQKKNINLKRIIPGSIVDIEFEVVNNERVATVIKTDLEDDGVVKLEGLLELIEDDIAYVDGQKVKLASNVSITGKTNADCDCKGKVFTSFKDPLLKTGKYFLEIKGKLNDDDGVIIAEEVRACKNLLLETDAKLRNAVEQSYNTSGLAMVSTPTDIGLSVGLPLHQGNIRIGQYSYKLHNDIRLQGYINSVGERVIPEHQKNLPDNDPNKLNFRFYVIDNPIPNAFAFPNGMIFVHTGILDVMENEAELAIVLGHEVSHVTHEHGRERYESSVLTGIMANIGEGLLMKFTRNSNLSPLLANAVKQTYAALRPEALANIFGAQPAKESQADRVGLQYALLAGYDIREAVGFWGKMAKITNDGNFKSRLNNDFRSMLSSADFSYGNPLNTLGEAGFGMLAKMFLDTVYTSHPKSKARARALNQLILTSYKNEDFEHLDKGAAMFEKYVKGVR
ncbi:MAG TPA: M48 family metallopeptidase [Saprospiraceae bacterium]|nr:M48 family metallopeptidase [Saprospiraceae bacterium]HRK83565.1 M48 family metallopeptidase [Saprospiraceae bacterium]